MEIIKNVYQITSGRFGRSNQFLIAEENLTLIDAGFGSSPKKIIQFIRSIGRTETELSLIIITHNHFDHTGGLGKLKRLTPAKIAAHENESFPEKAYSNIVQKLLNFPLFRMLKPLVFIKLSTEIVLVEGQELPVLGGLKIINTPGHTPGSISLLAPRHRILFCGDLINTRSNFTFPQPMLNNNKEELVSSLEKISCLDYDILCVGHGPPIVTNASALIREWTTKLEIRR